MMLVPTAKAVASVLACLLFAAAVAAAQDTSPAGASTQAPTARSGNIWSGKSHQPSRADVEAAEQNAGETTPRAEKGLDDKVDSIGRQLQQLEQRYPPGFLQQPPR